MDSFPAQSVGGAFLRHALAVGGPHHLTRKVIGDQELGPRHELAHLHLARGEIAHASARTILMQAVAHQRTCLDRSQPSPGPRRAIPKDERHLPP